MPHSKVLRVAVIGMGGYAGSHHDALHKLESREQCRVVATCDPAPESFRALVSEKQFNRRGISVYSDYWEMLDAHRDEIDFVTVPTPLHWHAEMHAACIDRGFACYLEKPPTLDWQEMRRMLAAESRAAHQTNVGFAHTVERPRQLLKQRLLRGDFGRIQRVGFSGYSPRVAQYFERSPWAGRLNLDGHLILDSCTGNAMSHYLYNLLFWCGGEEILSWGRIECLEAELYRAHAIESFDTCFARGRCANGIEIAIAATHTGSHKFAMSEWLECEKARIVYRSGSRQGFNIEWNDGRHESFDMQAADHLQENLKAYMSYLRGPHSRPLNRLIDAAAFVELNSMLFIAGRSIHAIDSAFIERKQTGPDETFLEVCGMCTAMKTLCVENILPGEGGAGWGVCSSPAHISALSQFNDVVDSMRAVPV